MSDENEEISKKIENLRPNKRYAIKVRAVNELGQFSGWSETIDYTTPGDISTPAPPTGLVLSFDTPSLYIDWTAPVYNTDGSILADLSGYLVTLSSGGTTAVFQVTDNRFVLSYDQNVASFGGAASIDVSVRAYDVTNRKSTALTGTAVNQPPPTPAEAPTLIPAITLVNIAMDKNSIKDFNSFDLYYSTSGATPSFIQLTVPDGDTSYTHVTSEGDTLYYRYKIIDVFGQVSPDFSPIGSTTTYLFSGEEGGDPPAQVENLVVFSSEFVQGEGATVELHWDAVPDSDVAFYQLRYKKASASTYSTIFVASDEVGATPGVISYEINGLTPAIGYDFVVRAVDLAGNEGQFSNTISGYVTPTDTVPPATPSGLTTTGGLQTIFVDWDPVSDLDLSGYELYGDTSSGFTPATPSLLARGNASSYVHGGLNPSDTWYYVVRAFDTFENYSGYAAEVSGQALDVGEFDTTPPATPTGFLTSSGLEAVEQIVRGYVTASWNKVSDSDMQYYVLQHKKDTDVYFKSTIVPHEDGQNTYSQTISNLTEASDYEVRVGAVDESGNNSGYTAISTESIPGDTTPPQPVDGLTAIPFIKSVRLSWAPGDAPSTPPGPDKDLAHYNIHVGTTSGFTPSSSNKYDSTLSTSITVNKYWDGDSWEDLVLGSTYYFKVAAVDRSGNISTYSSASNNPSKPPMPENLTLSTPNDFVSVSWDEPSAQASTIDLYELWGSYYGTEATPTNEYALVYEIIADDVVDGTVEVLDQNVTAQQAVFYEVYSVRDGYKSDPLTGSLNVDRTVSDPINFTVEATIASFILRYQLPADRMLKEIVITMDKNADSGSLSEGNAVEVARTTNDFYVYEIPDADLNLWHQFWVSSITRTV